MPTRTREKKARTKREKYDFGDELAAIGRKMRALRNKRGLTLEQVAEHAGITPNYLSKIELGKVNPGLRVTHAVAGALGVSMSVLLNGQDVEPSTFSLNRREVVASFPDAPPEDQQALLVLLRHAVRR